MLVKHQDGKVERGEFSDTFGEDTEVKKIGVERGD